MSSSDLIQPAVRLESVGRRFGSEDAVSGVNLDIAKGELVCFLGASGSGKTTLLRLIAGFDTPTSGSILLNGTDVSSLSPSRRNIGMVFQNYALFPKLTVQRNIEYGLKMRGWKRTERHRRAEEMLERMRLSRFASRYPPQLSGGQQQRVAIARALAYSPELVLMDEPLGALDKALKQEMLHEIDDVHREFGSTILYVTHDREEALTLADRVAIMRDSKLLACEPVEELFLRPSSAYVASFFSGANLIPAREERTDDGRNLVSVGASTLQVDADMPTAPFVLSVRPRDVRLTPNDEGWAIPGFIRHRSFFGDDVHMTVDAGSTIPDLTIELRVGLQDAGNLGIGDPVVAHVSKSAAHFVSGEPTISTIQARTIG